MDIGKRLRTMREQQGLSQYRLGKLAGVSQSFISDVESGGKSLTVAVLEKLCQGLGVSLAEFLSGSDKPLHAKIDPEVSRLLVNIKALNPEQVRRLNNFLASLRNHPPGEPRAGAGRPDLDDLLPRDEENLAVALAKISQIAVEYGLSEQNVAYLRDRATAYYSSRQSTGTKATTRGPAARQQGRAESSGGDE